MDDKIQSYRQPMVTATGILLGFLLNFAINWISKPSSIFSFKDIVSMLGLLSSITLLSIVLYRILNMDYPKDKVHEYYRRTLLFFISGLCCILASICIAMIESFLQY